jgi:hypothetical protein
MRLSNLRKARIDLGGKYFAPENEYIRRDGYEKKKGADSFRSFSLNDADGLTSKRAISCVRRDRRC